MDNNVHSGKAGIIAAGVLIAVIGGGLAYRSRANNSAIVFQEPSKAASSPVLPATPQKNSQNELPKVTETPATVETPAKPNVPVLPVEGIVVHVTGAVKKPGVYHLKVGSRGEEALAQAGGLTKDANPDALNLAAKLDDGSQLFFPTHKQEPKSPAEKEYLAGNAPVVVDAKTAASNVLKTSASTAKPSKTAAHSGASGGRGSSAKLTNPAQGMVNINKASAEELQKLPGIGPAMAGRVIAYRQESGGFQTPEDIMQISGIGPKKFERMKPFIKVK